ncbi:transcriptional regulator, IclR family [Saccharopolyspora shandongensis]|uniref:Transcriptional regulator, IclR family n=1 Tax=Saccharopolyspora shandongensis TaxID=418495 RepID=A0A1H3U3U3_9PSEU|nr:IclR family transcriptional regulator [Saccharopolyspora shandongensis]SDZ56535.1 transcriptional regulator, IclR family [Saccharopolyspora shandongensis]
MSGESTRGRSVTSKVLGILEAFESGSASLSLTRIAEVADLPLPTAYRLVRELVEWGALHRDDNGRYSVGLRLWEVAQNGGRQLRDAARPYLQDLFSLTQETAHLAVREGHEALYVDRIYSSKRVPRASRVGGRLPLHATAVGKVLLAYEDDWLREAYLARDLEVPTKSTHANPARLREELKHAREQGYATTFEEMRPGSCSIAVPVFGDSGRAVAAIGLVMLSTQAPQVTRYLQVLQGISRRIERAFARLPMTDVFAVEVARSSR